MNVHELERATLHGPTSSHGTVAGYKLRCCYLVVKGFVASRASAARWVFSRPGALVVSLHRRFARSGHTTCPCVARLDGTLINHVLASLQLDIHRR